MHSTQLEAGEVRIKNTWYKDITNERPGTDQRGRVGENCSNKNTYEQREYKTCCKIFVDNGK